MADEVLARAREIWTKLAGHQWRQFTLMDLVFVAGIVALLVLSVKLMKHFFKVVLILLAAVLLLLWLYSRGVLG